MQRVTGALVVANGPAALTVVAGLPLAVRAVLTLRAAGIPTVAVFAGPQQRRLAPLVARRCPGIPCLGTVEEAARLTWPTPVRPVLVVAGDALFDAAVLEPLLGSAMADTLQVGQLPGAVELAPVLTAPAALVPALLTDATRTLGIRAETLRRLGPVTPRPLAAGLFVPAGRGESPAALETALFDHLAHRTVGKDSYLAALIDRRLSRPVTALLLRWPITPSQVTLASLLLGLAGAAGLATVSYGGRIAGVLALIASVVLDCVDGEIARARFQQSAAGARLDVIGDYVVHLAVFVGLGVGLARQGLPPGGWWAIVALLAGVVAAMATIHGLFVRSALSRGDLHAATTGDLQGAALTAVVEKLASRDYTYLLLVLALLGHLEWFLYAAAVGSWVFVLGVLAYWGLNRRVVARRATETA